MSTSVVTVEMDDTLKTIKEIFDNAHFHHLMVVESGKLYGVLSDRDLLKSISHNIGTLTEKASDTASLNIKAHQIMTRKPLTLKRNANIYDAIKFFNDNNLSCIPVVDNENKPIGILSWRDILKVFASKK